MKPIYSLCLAALLLSLGCAGQKMETAHPWTKAESPCRAAAAQASGDDWEPYEPRIAQVREAGDRVDETTAPEQETPQAQVPAPSSSVTASPSSSLPPPSIKARPGMRVVQGRIIENGTNEPIAGATVTVVGSDAAAITEADGSFELEVSVEAVSLQVFGFGYETGAAVVLPQVNQVVVALDLETEETIVVTGRAPAVTHSQTAGARGDYDFVRGIGSRYDDSFDEVWIISRPPADQAAHVRGKAPALVATKTSSPNRAVPLPLVSTDVRARILAHVATVDVKQRYENPFDTKIEATYVFPLPHNSAVTEFLMTVGDRKICGIIRDRDEAEELYAEARSAGYTAALMTQERPNVFTQKVANIEPGNDIDIDITFFSTLSYRNGAYSFVFPTVVGPRYNPDGHYGGVTAHRRAVPTSLSNVGTPVYYLAPHENTGHRFSMDVQLDAGMPLGRVDSPSHAVHVQNVSARQRRITLARAREIPDRDFVLTYRVATEEMQPVAFVDPSTHRDGTFVVVLQPPKDLDDAPRVPVEMVFVLDCSGSMAGGPLTVAKQTIERQLDLLRPDDTFQIIRFSNDSSALGPAPLRATPRNVARAKRHLAGLQSMGGTEMIEGVKAALDFPHDPSRLRLVSFMTDGYIGNERQILGAVHDHLGAARIFSFGVGDAPNRYLLERMAKIGRGAVGYVALNDSSSVQAVSGFYEAISKATLTDVVLDFHGADVGGVSPAIIPDLYVGRPVVVAGRFRGELADRITVRAKAAGKPVSFDIPLLGARNHPALARLWARMTIADMSDRLAYEPDTEALGDRIKARSLSYGVLTDYTAFVAVDASRRTAGDHGVSVPQAVPVPNGVNYDTAVSPER